MTTTTAYTVAGWVFVAAVGTAYYYWPKSEKRNSRIVPSKQTIKKKVGLNEASSSEHRFSKDKSQKKKKRDQAIPSTSENGFEPPVVSLQEDSFDREELDNKEFARELQKAKSGKIAAPQSQASSKTKSVKQSRVDEGSKTSSTTGADADDDLSAANSPLLDATNISQSGGISDMLETVATGPSILRITESTKPAQPTKERKQAQEEVALTKKQRQTRQKTEQKKLAREEAEKERRILLEKQLRTARQAENRPAKDGSAFMASSASTSSAWTAPPTTSNDAKSNGRGVELLDTYEPAQNGANVALSSKPISSSINNSDWEVLPSEEEQIRRITEDSAWNTVATKKGKKKGGDTGHINSAEISQATKKPAPVQSTSSFSALKDEGDNVRTWEEEKGFTKTTPPRKLDNEARSRRTHEFTYEDGNGSTGVMTSKDDEWEVS